MQAGNAPTVPPVRDEALPPVNWSIIWNSLEPRAASVARALASTCGEEPWKEALQLTGAIVTKDGQEKIVSTS